MIALWSPAHVHYIARNVERSCDVPTLAMMIKTYSREAMMTLLNAHIVATFTTAGISDRFSVGDCSVIAMMICDNEKLRSLNLAYLLAFFSKFAQGEYPMYGCAPTEFMKSFLAYYNVAIKQQRHNEEQLERQRYEAEMAEHRKTAITWEQYCESRNISKSLNPLDIIINKVSTN